jgi:hypothetical protein
MLLLRANFGEDKRFVESAGAAIGDGVAQDAAQNVVAVRVVRLDAIGESRS